MSLSADERANIWREHRDSLTRIRSQLSVRTPTKVSPRKSPVVPGGRRSHSPYGRYRQSTPPYLPRLDTPPEHDKLKKNSKLRGNRYEIVPPLKDRRPSSKSDYDSWGEESDDEDDSGDEQGRYMPQQYPMGYPMQPYPMAPQVVWGPPFQMYYPPPPGRGKGRPKRDKGRPDVYKVGKPSYKNRVPESDRYEDVNQSLPNKGRKSRKKQQKVRYSLPEENGYVMPAPYFMPYRAATTHEDLYKYEPDKKYKYIYPRDTPFTPGEKNTEVYKRYKDEPDRLPYYYLKDHPLFGEQFVQYFINQCLDEFIPDVLIETLHGERKREEGHTPIHQVRDGFIHNEVPKLVHDTVREALNEMVNEYLLQKDSNKDPLEEWLTQLVNDAVREATTDVVRETVRDLAQNYVEFHKADFILEEFIEDYINLIGPELVNDAIIDLIAEEFLVFEVFEPELEEELPVIAQEVLGHFDDKVMRREMKAVSSLAGEKLMESFLLDYLMSLVSRQGKVWTESDHANKYMDDMISSILLGQFFNVSHDRRKTVLCKPLRKLHEKTVSDVALDVFLQQLSQTLDEDMADVDEYERGAVVPVSAQLSPRR